MAEDTRALRDALEAAQAALRDARLRIAALEAELAAARAPPPDAAAVAQRLAAAERDRMDVEALRQLLAAAERQAAEARERELRLEAAYEERGRRVQALAAELDRLRGQLRASRAPEVKGEPARPSGAPRPPPAPTGATPSARAVRVKPAGERPPSRPAPVEPVKPGRVIVGGAAAELEPEALRGGVEVGDSSTRAALTQPAGCAVAALALLCAALVAAVA